MGNKIMLIDDGKEWRGGQRQTLLLAMGMSKRGYEPFLVCNPDGELYKEAKKEKIPVYDVPMRGEWDAMAAWRLGNLAQEAEALHAQTSHSHTLALMGVRIGALRPVIVHRRVDFSPGVGAFSKWKYRVVDKFIAISNAVAASLKQSGVPNSKIAIVRSGVSAKPVDDAVKKDIRAELGLVPSTPIVGTVGQLVDHKGHRYLIEGMHELMRLHPGVHAVIAGSGELEAELKELARQKGVAERIHFLGYRKDALSIMKSFDVFVMPSHMEGLGTALLDAMIAGIPVCAAAAGGIPEVVQDGIDGILFQAKNPSSLALSVSNLLKNPAKSKGLAESASKKTRLRYTDEAMVDGVVGVYKEVLGK